MPFSEKEEEKENSDSCTDLLLEDHLVESLDSQRQSNQLPCTDLVASSVTCENLWLCLCSSCHSVFGRHTPGVFMTSQDYSHVLWSGCIRPYRDAVAPGLSRPREQNLAHLSLQQQIRKDYCLFFPGRKTRMLIFRSKEPQH